jgi:putative ABC transport system permease protein
LVKGRLIDESDRACKPPVVVISEELARQAWPGEDPLGKRLKRVRPGQVFPWMTVVGVVKDVKEDLFNYRINRPVWYVPYAQVENNFPVNLVVRTSADPTGLTNAIREVIHAVDSDQSISNVMTMNENLARVLVTERFSAILMGVLAGSGLLLAALGLYGVMAYSVSRRTTEIGVRVALGAQRGHVLQLILGQGAKLTLVGIAIGLAAAWALTRLLVSLLFEVNATDPATFVSISLLLISIALLACLFPAHRALKVDPMIALRAE